jgi:hypothetical protein
LAPGWVTNDTLVKTVAVPTGGTGVVTFFNRAQGTLRLVKNTTGGNGTFTFNTAGPSGVPQTTIVTSGGNGSTLFTGLLPGTYTVTETLPAGWVTDGSLVKTVSIGIGQTGTVTFNNQKLGTIIIVKQLAGLSSTFTFSTAGTTTTSLPNPIKLVPPSDGNASSTNTGLLPGSYTITELGPGSGYTFTDVGCVESGGATIGDSTTILALQRGIANLQFGETVTCTFTNSGLFTTRTQGFWQTHLSITTAVWFGGTAGGNTFPGVADPTICGNTLTVQQVMAGFWSNIAKVSTGKGKDAQRSDVDKAKMQLLQQLLAAILNQAAFGSSPQPPQFNYTIEQAKTIFCNSTDVSEIRAAASAMGAFNEAGDSGAFTPGDSADPAGSKEAAGLALAYWDVPVKTAKGITLEVNAGAIVTLNPINFTGSAGLPANITLDLNPATATPLARTFTLGDGVYTITLVAPLPTGTNTCTVTFQKAITASTVGTAPDNAPPLPCSGQVTIGAGTIGMTTVRFTFTNVP